MWIGEFEEAHKVKVDKCEKEGIIVFGGESTKADSIFYYFNSKDQRFPFDFIHQVQITIYIPSAYCS